MRKHMKSRCILVTLMLVVAMLVGCSKDVESGNMTEKESKNTSAGNKSNSSQEKVELTVIDFFVPGEGVSLTLDPVIEQFLVDNPNIMVEREVVANSELKTKVQTLAAVDDLPDIYMLKGQMASTFVENGKVLAIDDLLDANIEWRDNFKEGVFSNFQFDGKTYAVPFQVTNTVAYYNSEMFEKAGIESFPATWDELLIAVEKLKNIGVTPIALGNKDKWPAESIIFSTLGNRVTGDEWYQSIRDNSGAKFTDEEFVRALSLFRELAEVNAFNADLNSTDNSQQRQMYMNGEAAIIFDGSWAINDLENNCPKEILENTEFGAIPAVEGGKGNQDAITGGAGWAYAINANIDPEKIDEAIAYITVLTDAEYAKSAMEQGLITAQYPSEEVDHSDQILTSKFNEFVKDRAYIPVYDHQLDSGVIEEMNSGLQELLQGIITSEELAERIQTQYER